MRLPEPINWDHLRQIEAAPWDRIPPHGESRGETDKAWAYFQAYRDLGGERSMTKVAAQYGIAPETLRDYSQRWFWRKRVEAWDDYLNEVAKQTQVDAVAEMNGRHARTAVAMLVKVAQRLVGDDTAGVKAIDPNTLTAGDLARLGETAVKIERLARESESMRLGTESLEPPTTVKLAFDPIPQYPSSTPQVEPPAVDGSAIRVDEARGEGPVLPESPPALEIGADPDESDARPKEDS